MNEIRRFGKKAAYEKAKALALQLIQETNHREWIPALTEINVDPILQTKVGKTPRHWLALVEYKNVDGGGLDGPAVIKVDLEQASAKWA